jgi:hypothetical protein
MEFSIENRIRYFPRLEEYPPENTFCYGDDDAFLAVLEDDIAYVGYRIYFKTSRQAAVAALSIKAEEQQGVKIVLGTWSGPVQIQLGDQTRWVLEFSAFQCVSRVWEWVCDQLSELPEESH